MLHIFSSLYMSVGILRFRCTLCPRVYTTRRGLRTHMKYHSSDRPHRCATCNASFKVRSKLADHVKLVHIQKVIIVFDPFTAYSSFCSLTLNDLNVSMQTARLDKQYIPYS